MEKLTVSELRAKAKDKGISGYSKMKKQELIDALSKKSSKKKNSDKSSRLQSRLDELDKMFDQVMQMDDVKKMDLKSEFEKVLSKPVRKLIAQLKKAYDEKVEMEELEEIEAKVSEKLQQALEVLNYHMEKADHSRLNRIKSDVAFIISFISFIYGFNFSKSLVNKSLKKNTEKVKEFIDEIHDYENQLDKNEISLDEFEENLKRIVAVVIGDSTEYIQQTKDNLSKLFNSMTKDLELFNMKNEYKLIKEELEILNENLQKLDELSVKELAEINRLAISLDNNISNTIDKLNEKIRKTRQDEIMEGNCSGDRNVLIALFDHYKLEYDEDMTDSEMCDIIFRRNIENIKDFLDRQEKVVCPEDVACKFTRQDYWYHYFMSNISHHKIPKQTYTNFFKRGIVDPVYAKNLIKLFIEIFPPLNEKLNSDVDEQVSFLNILHKHILDNLSNYSINELKDYKLTPMNDYSKTVRPPSPVRQPSPKRTPSPARPVSPKMTNEERKVRISERKKKRSEKEQQRREKYQKEKAEKLKEQEAERALQREEEEEEERKAKVSPKRAAKIQKEHEEFLQKVKRKPKPASPKLDTIKDKLQSLVADKIKSGVDQEEAIELSGKIAEASTKSQLEKIGEEVENLKVKTPPRIPSPRKAKTPSPRKSPKSVEDEYVPVRSRVSPPRGREIMRSAVSITPPPAEEEYESEEEEERPKLDIDAAFSMLEDF